MNASMLWQALIPARFRQDSQHGGWALAARRGPAAGVGRTQDVPILVVASDHWFRDRVLIPSLQALRFSHVRAADNLTLARRELCLHPEPGILVYDTPADYVAGDKAVSDLTRDRSLSLVLLRADFAGTREVADGAELVLFKRGTTILDTVRAIEDVARRWFASHRRRQADDRAGRSWESGRARDRSRDARQQDRGWGNRERGEAEVKRTAELRTLRGE